MNIHKCIIIIARPSDANVGPTLVRRWYNVGSTLVRRWSNNVLLKTLYYQPCATVAFQTFQYIKMNTLPCQKYCNIDTRITQEAIYDMKIIVVLMKL